MLELKVLGYIEIDYEFFNSARALRVLKWTAPTPETEEEYHEAFQKKICLGRILNNYNLPEFERKQIEALKERADQQVHDYLARKK